MRFLERRLLQAFEPPLGTRLLRREVRAAREWPPHREETMRYALTIALVAVLLAGCAALKSGTPYNAQEACEGSGGTYGMDGSCSAGLE